MLLALGFDVEAVLDPLALLAGGPFAATVWRWSMVLDLLGYYLLIIPLILLLRRWLGTRHPGWADLCAVALLSYSFVGGGGAAIHAAVLPPLVRAYATADAGQQDGLRLAFLTAHNAVMYGLWNLFNALVSAVGWLGFGILLLRERRVLGVLTLLLGLSALIDAAGVILGVESLAFAGLMVYIVLAPLWAGTLGLDLLHRPVQWTAEHTDQHFRADHRLPVDGSGA